MIIWINKGAWFLFFFISQRESIGDFPLPPNAVPIGLTTVGVNKLS